jgi:hypothetical protein
MKLIYPETLEAAVTAGLDLLDARGRHEIAGIGIFNPHMKYKTDFFSIIGLGMGIVNRENVDLMRDIEKNHIDEIHFIEIDDGGIDFDAVMRVVMAAISREASKLM